MIFVARTSSAAAAAALSKRSKGLTELEAALWFYAGVAPELDPLPEKPAEAPGYAAYGDPDVKSALHQIFDGHCAYCESRYEHVAPMDVEHYRPKGAIIEANGKRTKPGYYWAAADWDNLLPSCISCNRERAQEQMLDDGTTEESKSGKGNQFPLRVGTPRATCMSEQGGEHPLLLHPCVNDPKPHLVFRADGYVEPRSGPEEGAEPKGLATIEVCGLDRASLVENRRKASTRLREAMQAVIDADLNLLDTPSVPRLVKQLATREAALDTLSADMDYRALTRTMRTLFDATRAAISTYYTRERAWLDNRTPEARAKVVAAATAINDLRDGAGPFQEFVAEMVAWAELPPKGDD
ncbi:MAG: hypothetical protein WDN24_03580 [Sphingomonas sp.]